jgi:PTS system nitrogen regulatory IIA component
MPHSQFDVPRLAKYLHIPQKKVIKLAERGKLPGRRVEGDWRFARGEIHQWLEERIGVYDDQELANVEGALRRSAPAEEPEEILLAERLPEEAIAIPLNARTQPSVIRAMTELAMQTGLLWDDKKMAEAVQKREELHSTALENGVALLHPRRPQASILGGTFLALGITFSGIPFGGSRGQLTDIFFLLCSMNDSIHLRLLTRLSRILSSEDFIEQLRACGDAAAARELIAKTEKTIA